MNGRWIRAGDVLVRRVHSGILLLPRRAESPFLLTGSGMDLWDRLAEPVSLAEVVFDLVARYHLPGASVEEALLPVMRDLASRAAIVEVAA